MSQELLAYMSSSFEAADETALQDLVGRLSQRESWTLDPPQFVDEVDFDGCTQPQDEPVRTVGVALRIAPPDAATPTPAAEVERLLAALGEFSSSRAIDFEVQLGQTFVGEIRDGSMDRLLRVGLLGTW